MALNSPLLLFVAHSSPAVVLATPLQLSSGGRQLNQLQALLVPSPVNGGGYMIPRVVSGSILLP